MAGSPGSCGHTRRAREPPSRPWSDQVPPTEMKAFRGFLGTLGYPHRDESANPAYRLFLRG